MDWGPSAFSFPRLDGTFAENVEAFSKDVGRRVHVSERPDLACWLVKLPAQKSLFVFKEVLEQNCVCDGCRIIGWAGHPVSAATYHFIVPNETGPDSLNDPSSLAACTQRASLELPEGKQSPGPPPIAGASPPIESARHCLHLSVHSNGCGHLNRLNGLEGQRQRAEAGDAAACAPEPHSSVKALEPTRSKKELKGAPKKSLASCPRACNPRPAPCPAAQTSPLSGAKIMALMQELCRCLRVHSVSVEDASTKLGMPYRLLHAAAAGCTWYGAWGFALGRGVFGQGREQWAQAADYVADASLKDLLHDLRPDDGGWSREARILVRWALPMAVGPCALAAVSLGQVLTRLLRFLAHPEEAVQFCHRKCVEEAALRCERAAAGEGRGLAALSTPVADRKTSPCAEDGSEAKEVREQAPVVQARPLKRKSGSRLPAAFPLGSTLRVYSKPSRTWYVCEVVGEGSFDGAGSTVRFRSGNRVEEMDLDAARVQLVRKGNGTSAVLEQKAAAKTRPARNGKSDEGKGNVLANLVGSRLAKTGQQEVEVLLGSKAAKEDTQPVEPVEPLPKLSSRGAAAQAHITAANNGSHLAPFVSLLQLEAGEREPTGEPLQGGQLPCWNLCSLPAGASAEEAPAAASKGRSKSAKAKGAKAKAASRAPAHAEPLLREPELSPEQRALVRRHVEADLRCLYASLLASYAPDRQRRERRPGVAEFESEAATPPPAPTSSAPRATAEAALGQTPAPRGFRLRLKDMGKHAQVLLDCQHFLWQVDSERESSVADDSSLARRLVVSVRLPPALTRAPRQALPGSTFAAPASGRRRIEIPPLEVLAPLSESVASSKARIVAALAAVYPALQSCSAGALFASAEDRAPLALADEAALPLGELLGRLGEERAREGRRRGWGDLQSLPEEKPPFPPAVNLALDGLPPCAELGRMGGREDWLVLCSCGTRDDDGARMMCCDACGCWAHSRCQGVPDEAPCPSVWICPGCAAAGVRREHA